MMRKIYVVQAESSDQHLARWIVMAFSTKSAADEFRARCQQVANQLFDLAEKDKTPKLQGEVWEDRQKYPDPGVTYHEYDTSYIVVKAFLQEP